MKTSTSSVTKNLILIIALIGLMSSCKKDYQCSCTSVGPNGVEKTTVTVYHETKKQALAGQCASYSSNPDGGEITIVTCKLH